MGLAWKPPDMHALQHVLGRHGGLGLGANTPAAEADDAAADRQHTDTEALELVDLEAARAKKIAGTRVRAVLKMLASEAGFMVNPQVQESLAQMPADDAEVSRAETMLKALGVKTEERLNTLVDYFFVEKKEEVARFPTDMHDEGQEFEQELMLLLKVYYSNVIHFVPCISCCSCLLFFVLTMYWCKI